MTTKTTHANHEAPATAGALSLGREMTNANEPQTQPIALRPEVAAWKWVDAPATTVQGDPRITAREHHFHGEQSKTSLKLTLDEAAALQTYPTPADKWTPTSSPINGKAAIARVKALDLFAGTGWGVACQRLGIKESGVEIMPEAVATRTANGMETIYNDVWDGLQLTAEQHREQYGSYGLLIASPPCQTFSLAGKGAGRAALDEVLEAIELHAYKDAAALLAFGEAHDMRTALVLAPLAYAWRDRPRLVAMEQVPTVLPVWEACAEVMREWGYEVKVEVLNAEQYGVPQTRKRAILVARRGGPVDLPTPTHSRYYSRTPDKLDPGVKKWVSMAEALGWGMTDRPYLTVTGGGDKDTSKHQGGTAPSLLGSKAARARVTSEMEAGRFTFPDEPGRQLTSPGGELKLKVEEAAALQSYPAGRGLTDRPAPTITGGGTETGGAEPIAKYHERYTSAPGWVGSTDRLSTAEAAALQSYPTGWGFTDRPAVTVGNAVGRGLIGGSGAKEAVVRAIDDGSFIPSPHGDGTDYANQTRITVAEAGVIQSYERPFVWCGTKTKQFLQIGNAVPPLLAEHILAALIGIPTTQEKA